MLTIAIRSDCRGSCKLHASLQQNGLRKSSAAHTPGAPGRLEHQGEGAGLDSSSPCRRFCASVDHRSELCQLRTCTCVCFWTACSHCVRMCFFRALVIFTRFLQNACRLSSFFFVLCCPTGGENQYAVSSSTFALAASCGGELRILLLGLFMTPGKRKRQRVPLT